MLALRQLDGAAVVDVCELWEYEGQFLKSSLFSNTIIDHGEAFANGTLNRGEGHSGGACCHGYWLILL